MTLHVYDKLEQGTEEWKAARRGMVTASVVGGLLSVRTYGASDYDCPKCDALAHEPCISQARGKEPTPIKTAHPERAAYAAAHADESPLIVEPANGKAAHSLTALLTAERITDWTQKTFTSDDMMRGKDYEPVAVWTYAEHYGVPVTTVGLMVLEQDGYRLGYSPDALVGDEGLLEVKAPRQKGQLTTVLGDQVPADHMAQLQCGLLVSGRKWIDFVSVCADMALWSKRVYPDPDWFAAITSAVKQFEATSAEMIATYNDRTEGLPVAERLPDFDDVELKL
jgi:hypothetical protein